MIGEQARPFPTALPSHSRKLAFAILAAVLAAAILRPNLSLLAFGALAVLVPLLYFTFRLMDGDAEPVMLLWVALFPLGYYFLTFPKNGAIVTFDRVAVAGLATGIFLCPLDRFTRIPAALRSPAWAWAAFLVAALLSLVRVERILGPLKWCLEAFFLPALLGWYVVACFPVRRYLRPLHAIICIVAIYCAAIGAAEMALNTDLLPIPGAGEYIAGMQGFTILRVNGPFSSNNSFGLIGLLTFCILAFLREAIGKELPRWQRALNAVGITAALIQAVMPLFRSIFLTILLILILEMFRNIGWQRKLWRAGVLVAMGLAVLILMMRIPELFQERVSDAGNIYARIAQQRQNLLIFLDHPLLGVGFTNFSEVASRRPHLTTSYGGVEALDSPHNMIAAVLAETGLTGFVPFLVSQFTLVAAFWRLRASGGEGGRLAWTFFLYIFLSYWISGMALTSGYYPDLNMWFLFCLTLVYKYTISPQGGVR